MSVCNSPLRKIVGRELDVDAVAHQDADAVAAHTARDSGENDMLALLYLYFEKCIGLFVDYDPSHFYKFFFHLVRNVST